jgi:hypothetical protein
MNINMLRDADDNANIYAAVCASLGSTVWAGAGLWVSIDGGANYTFLANLTAEATMGITTNAQAAFAGGNIPDELTSVNVRLYHGTLASTTNDGLLSGVYCAIIGDEIEFFRDAELEADGTYTVTGFLRGRRGSESAMTTHAVGERFILVNVATMADLPQITADIGQTRLYKAVTADSTLAATTAKSFTNNGARLKPYSPVHLGGGLESNGDWTLNWVRRSRTSGEWRDSVDVPLGESTEAYEVEIWNSSFTTLKRTITGLTSPAATYTAAQQNTDFGGAQTDVYFAVYQLSATVGRGYAGYGHVASTGAAAPAAPPAPSPPPAPPAPAPEIGTIAVASIPDTILQSNAFAGEAYWVHDNTWGPGSLVRGTYNGTTQYEQYVGISHELGVNGEVAYRQVWKWPEGTTEVKSYPSVVYGAHPGWYNTGTTPGGLPILLPDLSYSTVAPCGPTPGTFLPRQLPLAALYSSFAYEHLEVPTGRGHLSYDIWLQSSGTQVNGFGNSPITHEIMIPLNYWGDYGSHSTRNPGWYQHDVMLEGYLWHVYYAPDFNGAWKFVVFEPDSAEAIAIPGILNLATFINYVATQGWATGNEHLMSIELGVEPNYGTGDLVVSNFRVWE